MCWSEALTNKELAARLGRNPATVLHHVRTLVDTGFLVAQPPRRGTRGSREVPYRATGKSWLMDVDDRLGPRDPMLEAFLEEVAEAGEARLGSSRLGLRPAPGERAEFRPRAPGLPGRERPRPPDPPPPD